MADPSRMLRETVPNARVNLCKGHARRLITEICNKSGL